MVLTLVMCLQFHTPWSSSSSRWNSPLLFPTKEQFWCRNVCKKGCSLKSWRTNRRVRRHFLWAFLGHLYHLYRKWVKQGLGRTASDHFSYPLGYQNTCMVLAMVTTWNFSRPVAFWAGSWWGISLPPLKCHYTDHWTMLFITDFPPTSSQNHFYLAFGQGWF